MKYYLGIDIGTTSVKTVAFSVNGEVIISSSCAYIMYHPQPSWSEQDPAEVLAATAFSCNRIISSLKNPPEFIAFSTALHGLIVVDKEGVPLTKCIIWADNRAADIADHLKETETGKSFYHLTGVPIHAMSPFCKLIWLKENDPVLFDKAYKFISIKEYIFKYFFDEYVIDTAVASATGLLNINSLCWEETILQYLHITPSLLSRLVAPKHKFLFRQGAVTGKNSLLIPDGTPWIIGGSDGALANLGSGAINPDCMAISIGTSSAARVVTDKVETDIGMRTFCYHLKDDLYIIGGPSNNGAVVLEWLKDKLLEAPESFADFLLKAEQVMPGSADLFCIPYIFGERAPIWNSNARGVFFGLNINHTKAHLVRACMEGVIYAVYSIARILLEKRGITEIQATGGFVQSELWLQMLADVCNIKVQVSGAVESSARGAVMIGLEALEQEAFPPKEVLTTYEPNLGNNAFYRKGFQKFEQIYASLQNEFAGNASLPF